MNKYHPIFTYLLIFFALSILLRLFGIIDFDTTEIISYALIFYGFSIVYTSMGKQKRVTLFLGSSIFLVGVVLFVMNNFEFESVSGIWYASLIFIAGISFFIIYLDDSAKKIYLLLSLIFIFAGFIFTIRRGSINISLFLISLVNVVKEYWPVILVTIGIILIISREERNK